MFLFQTEILQGEQSSVGLPGGLAGAGSVLVTSWGLTQHPWCWPRSWAVRAWHWPVLCLALLVAPAHGAVFCKAVALIFLAGLEGWDTRESETAVEKGGKSYTNNPQFFVLAVFLFRKEFICYRSE